MKLFEVLNPNVRFEYHEDIEGDKNRGFQVDKIEAFIGDENVGYLKIAYIPRKRWEKWHPSILNWYTQFQGSSLLPHEYKTSKLEDIPTEELAKDLAHAWWASPSADDINYSKRNEIYQQMQQIALTGNRQQILDAYHQIERDAYKHKGKLFKRFENYFVDKAYVDFIRVEDKYQRQGIATALYRAGYEWMKSKGMPFYASGTQSKDAKATWRTLKKRYPVARDRYRLYGNRLGSRYRFAEGYESEKYSLEQYRQHALHIIKLNISWMEQLAQDTLNVYGTIQIKPIGSVTNPNKFTHNSDVDVGFFIDGGTTLDESLSSELQDVFIKHPLEHIGVINTLVFK